jgi:hypothetical protein
MVKVTLRLGASRISVPPSSLCISHSHASALSGIAADCCSAHRGLHGDHVWSLDAGDGLDTIERPEISIDSDGTIYVGTSDPRYESGQLFAVWGP